MRKEKESEKKRFKTKKEFWQTVGLWCAAFILAYIIAAGCSMYGFGVSIKDMLGMMFWDTWIFLGSLLIPIIALIPSIPLVIFCWSGLGDKVPKLEKIIQSEDADEFEPPMPYYVGFLVCAIINFVLVGFHSVFGTVDDSTLRGAVMFGGTAILCLAVIHIYFYVMGYKDTKHPICLILAFTESLRTLIIGFWIIWGPIWIATDILRPMSQYGWNDFPSMMLFFGAIFVTPFIFAYSIIFLSNFGWYNTKDYKESITYRGLRMAYYISPFYGIINYIRKIKKEYDSLE